MAHDQALAKVMQHLLKDDTQVYKQFVENESFKRVRRRHGVCDHESVMLSEIAEQRREFMAVTGA